MTKIDLDKFICSWLKAKRYCSDNESWYVITALKEQGLDYDFKDEEIVEIEQEDLRKWLNFENTHEGITIPKDLKGTDTDGGVVGEQGEQFTEEEMVGMGGLGKVWKEQAIINKLDKIIELLQSAILPISRSPYVPPIIYKNPLDPDPNTLGGWETTASTEGGEE